MANTTVNIDVQVQTKSLQELEDELEDINKQLKEVPVGSEAFKELSGQAQQVTKELDKVNREVEGFTLDKKIETSQAAVLGFAGSLEAVVGTLGLLGIESEVFGEFEEKAISALTAARGLIDLSEGFGKLTKAINLSSLAAQTFGKVSRKALIGTGIGALVVATGAIVANFDKIVNLFNKLKGEAKKLQTEYEKLLENSQSQVNVLNTQLQSAQLLGESTEEITADIRQQLILQEEYNMKLIESLNTQLEQENNDEKRQELQAQLNTAKERQATLEFQLLSLNEQQTEQSQKNLEAEQEYQRLTEDVVTRLSEFRKQTEQEILDSEREAVRERIDTLEIEDDKKRDLLDQYEQYFEQKQEEITRTQEEEERKRTLATLQGQADRFNAGEANRQAIISRIRQYNEQISEDELFFANKTTEELLDLQRVQQDKAFTDRQFQLEQERQATAEYYDNLLTQAEENGASIQEIARITSQANEALRLKDVESEAALNAFRLQQTKDRLELELQLEAEKFNKIRQFQEGILQVSNRTLEAFTELSSGYFEREESRLARERSAIESNTNLTVEQREAALNNIEQKENALEKRRIERERDLFTVKQSLLLAEEILKTKLFVQEQIRTAQLIASQATAAGQEVAVEGAKQVGKASMSLGSFVSTLGPLGIALFAASIGGIIASIISARRKANEQIKSISGAGIGGGGAATPTTPVTPAQNQQPTPPQQIEVTPITKTYVLTGDVTNGQEAEAKLNTKRTI